MMIKQLKRIALCVVLALSSIIAASAATGSSWFVRGIVRDSISNDPLPYASVMAEGASRGVVADARGIFEIAVPMGTKALTVANVGYQKLSLPIKRNSINMYVVYLKPEATELNEVVVHRKKYSKRNNPAVDFVQRIKQRAALTDPIERHDYYSYDKYECITLALNDYSIEKADRGLLKKIPSPEQHIDTSEVSGKPILNVAIKEKASHMYNRRHPRSTKEVIDGERSEGIDEIADRQSMQTFYRDVMREVDLYQSDINILQNRFVSPLSAIAPDFYKFYLTDTVEVDGERCIVLSFYPHNKASFGFIGHVYVPQNDTTMFIKRVEMRVSKDINLNFIDELYLSQTYARAADGSRLKTSDDMTMEMHVLPGTQGLYARRNTLYCNHSFEVPADSSIFSALGAELREPLSQQRDSLFWQQARQRALQQSEANVATLMQKLRRIPLFYWGEKALKVLVTGYVPTAKVSKFDFGPVNTLVSHNGVEGWRFRVGGMTTANLCRRLFGRGYVAYGVGDRKLKYRGELEYSFLDKEYHSREFPVHSLRLTHLYDTDMIGQHYLFTNADNVFLSLKRMTDNRMTYHRYTSLLYTLELRNNFSVMAELAHERQYATAWLPFVDGAGRSYDHYDETSLKLTLRYAPGEKFYQGKTHRYPINLDAPVFTITHTIAPQGWLGNTFCINKTELNVQKRFWLSAFGFIDAYIGAGHIWSRVPYINLLIPNANLSYTIQPQSFALMNPMEFVNSTYGSIDITYWLNGALLNMVPYVKRLRLREVVSFRGIYGGLNQRCDPANTGYLFRFPTDVEARRMDHGPYMEASVGLDNILSCLRVDYVWRLSYRNVPYEIDRGGIRVALHITF